jgi:hypothetical protein
VSVAEVEEVERREGSALELCRASCEWVVDGQRALLGRGSYSQVPWKWRGRWCVRLGRLGRGEQDTHGKRREERGEARWEER